MLTTVFLGKLRAWLRYRESVRELSALSDRSLSDIGVSRSQIDQVARELAFR